MGQAWCKERTSKAQDSKSPLDRVFVRCAHRIYPGLKEEGSVLGGATQRVTSSEIGYAGSPPREALTRGRSIDSVDRPFHPSDWVDVNLEVPSTPRASSVLTNLTADTSLYPATTPTSSCSNLKDATPVPPPRRRKRNRGRPLPPKPDEVQENVSNNSRHAEANEEPLYSSVKLPRRGSIGVGEGGVVTPGAKAALGAGEEEPTLAKIHEGRRTKEIYEHKVNGTGRIIPSEVVSGKREKRSSDFSNHQRKFHETDEYEKFTRGQLAKDSSTPNRRPNGRDAKDVERSEESRNQRPKNYSTVSLPNYDELDALRHRDGVARIRRERGQEDDEEVVEEEEDGRKVRSRRPVRCSTVSLPAESFLSPFSQKTSVRLEDYVQRRGSAEHLLPYQVLGKLSTSQNGIDEEDDDGFVKYDPSKLEDWDLSDIGNCELNHRRRSYEDSPPLPRIIGEDHSSEDVVDHCAQDGNNRDGERIVGRKVPRIVEDRGGGKGEGVEGPGARTASPQKPVAFRKIGQSSVDFNRDSNDLDNWIVGQNRSSKYFDPPTMEICKTSSPSCQANARREPFFLNERKDDRTSFDTIGGSCRSTEAIDETDRSVEPSRRIFGRSLSNESEPYDDPYESKELRVDPEVTGKLIRTISEESLPREMLQEVVETRLDDFFENKLSKDTHNKFKKDQSDQKIAAKTPPPSPEPKIKAEILDNDHSILLKVLKDEHAEESNLSSMTPSLTELEAALSDMLEKEDTQDIIKDQERGEKREELEKGSSILRSNENPIEPKIVPIEKAPGGFVSQGGSTVSEAVLACDRILVDERGSLGVEEPNDSTRGLSPGPSLDSSRSPAKGRKVSFCAWEENRLEREGGEESIGDREDSKTTTTLVESDKRIIVSPPMDRLREEESFQDLLGSPGTVCSASSFEIAAELLAQSKGEARTDDAPEKPSRLHRANIEESIEGMESVPTPPRRKHRSTGAGAGAAAAAVSKDAPTPPATQNGSKSPELDPFAPNDRLI